MTKIAVPRCAVVTGGAGFIGSHVVDRLLEFGCKRVVVIDDLSVGQIENVPDGAYFVHLDIAAPFAGRAIASFEPDVIFHLAACTDVQHSFRFPVEHALTNVIGTIRVLGAAERCGAKVILASTGGAIYGECAAAALEDDPLEPVSPYAVSKLAAENFLQARNRIDGTEHVILRYANVYGPRQIASLEGGVVAIFLDGRARGESVTIFGDGEQTRDFVHVADVADATIRAFGLAAGVYNVGTAVETSINALAELIGVDADHAPARPGDLRRSLIDSRRLAQALSGAWNPTLLRVGIAEMLGSD